MLGAAQPEVASAAPAGVQDAGLTLTLTLRPTTGEPTFVGAPAYRRLDWAD